jgi:hypothetical protein
MNAILLGLILLFLAAAFLSMSEGFGMSPGTMVQLATSHVPTREDVDFYQRVYPRLVRREVAELTGEDPGALRAWTFPSLEPVITLRR